MILLNKVDLASESQIVSTEELIKTVNPTVLVHRTIQGNIDLGLVMGITAYTSPPSFQKAATISPHDCQSEHDHSESSQCSDPPHYQLRGISSLQIPCPILSPLHLEKLDAWIRTVLWENRLPDSETADRQLHILRCKGFFTTQSGEQYILQGVQNLYEISLIDTADGLGVSGTRKLVLIGKGLDDVVRRSLEDVFK